MREILFRGKSLYYGKWVEGFLEERKTPLQAALGGGIRYICAPRQDGDSCELYDVAPETVGQYIGLNDMDGRKIFEGDLVKIRGWEPPVMQVAFIEGAFCLADAEGECVGDIHYIHHAGVEAAKVIGNIHENMDVLTKAWSKHRGRRGTT